MSDLHDARAKATAFAALHVAELSKAVNQWQDTGLLEDGLLHELAELVRPFASVHAMQSAESLVNRAARNLATHAGAAAAAEPVTNARQDYPPLPEMQDLGDSGATNYGYDAQSMRDYVEADRKARQLSACNFCLSQAAEARAALTSAPEVPETPTEKQKKLLDLADRIDHEQLWRWAGMDHDKMTPEQKDRLDAGVALRRYARLWAPGRWVIFPPEGPVHWSASTLDKAYKMAKK